RRGGYVLDLFHSGWERRLLATIRRDAARRIHAVQISDVKRVTLRTMDRALLGKGILPLRAIFRALERGGYRGWYEAEIISDDLERMGYERALRQTRAACARLVSSSGAAAAAADSPGAPPRRRRPPVGAPAGAHPPAAPPRPAGADSNAV